MKNNATLSILFFFFLTIANAQTRGIITGVVMDEDQDETLAFANVNLYKKGTTKPFKSVSTNELGVFLFKNIPFGKYSLEASFLGMKLFISQELTIDKAHLSIAMDDIFLVADNRLEEVNVTTEKVSEQGDLVKKVFNVDKNINNAGGTALDAMRNIPALNVGIDGGVQLRGSSNVKILINGRPSSLIGSGGEQSLDQIPASSIEAIEVITNPSAKYEASGKTGIINIIMKKPSHLGFNYNLNLMAGTQDKWNAGINMNYRTNKWNWRTGYSFKRSYMPSWHTLNRQIILPDTTSYLDEASEINKRKIGHTASFGIDWNPTKQISAFTSITVNPHTGQKDSHYNYTFADENQSNQKKKIRNTQDNEAEMGLQFELGINKKFSRKGMTWNSVYTFDNGTKKDSVLGDVHFLTFGLVQYDYDKNQREQTITTHRLQSDFSYPFTKSTKFETGFVYSDRGLQNDFAYFNKEAGNWIPNVGRTNDFKYAEKIAAGYIMATTHWNSWEFNAGLRAENTDVVSELAHATERYPNNYLNFFPSGHIAVDVLPKGLGKVMLSYSRRIKRPSYRLLNPFASYNDSENIHQGNPLLRPELTESVELGWQSHWKKGSINPVIFYRYTKDKTGYYPYVKDGIRVLTFRNLKNSIAQGAEINGSYNPAKWIRLSGNISYFMIEKDGSNLDNVTVNEGDMYMARIMLSLKMLKNLDAQFSTFYNSGFVGLTGTSKAMKNMDFGMTYRVFNNRGKFIFKISDVFKSRGFAMHVATQEMKLFFDHRRDSQVFWLGFNWELKHSKSKRRRSRNHGGGGGGMEF